MDLSMESIQNIASFCDLEEAWSMSCTNSVMYKWWKKNLKSKMYPLFLVRMKEIRSKYLNFRHQMDFLDGSEEYFSEQMTQLTKNMNRAKEQFTLFRNMILKILK